MSLYNSDGQINTTQVNGSTYTGLFAADGSWNIVVNSSSNYVGLFHPCGALNAVIVNDPYSSYYNANGSINVVYNASGLTPVQPNGDGNYIPNWVVNPSNPPDIDFNFTLNSAWTKGVGTASASSLLTCSRASVAYASDNSGNWIQFAANTPRITNSGLLVEESRTNSIRNNTMQGAVVMADGVELNPNSNFNGGSGATCPGYTVNVSAGVVNFTGTSMQVTGDGISNDVWVAVPVSGLTVGRNYVVSIAGTQASLNLGVGTAANVRDVVGFTGVVPTGNPGSTASDRIAFTATASTLWVTLARTAASVATVTSISVQDGERVQNGNFALNPINASQNTLQNGWQWAVAGGTSTVTYAANAVTISPDGTNIAKLFSAAIPTVPGFVYTITADITTNGCGVAAGTSAGGSTLLNVTGVSPGTGLKFQFIATTATSFITFYKTGAGNSVVSNVSVQSAGALPTNWFVNAIPLGCTYAVTAVGTVNGANTVSIFVNGTNTSGSTAFPIIVPEANSTTVAAQGQTWSASTLLQISGTTSQQWGLRVIENNDAGGFLQQSLGLANGNYSTFSQATGSYTLVNASTARVNMDLALSVGLTNGTTISQTLTIGWPQLENNILVNSTVASATVAAGGTGGTAGTAVYSIGGGTGTAATLNVTVSGGAITAINSVASAGNYTVFPPSPATLTYVSGTGTGVTGATVNLTPTNNATLGFATSPILTNGSAALRNADFVSMPVTGVGAQYSLYSAVTPEAPAGYPNQFYLALGLGASNQFALTRFLSGTFGVLVNSGGSGFAAGGLAANVLSKTVAAFISGGNQRGTTNGNNVGSASQAGVPAGINTLFFSTATPTLTGAFLHQSAAVWLSQALPDTQMVSITT